MSVAILKRVTCNRFSKRFDIPVNVVESLWAIDNDTKLRIAEYLRTQVSEARPEIRPCAR